MENVKEDRTLDLSGLSCPLPVVMTSETMRKMEEGQVLKVISTDPGFERDIWSWAKQSGNILLKVEKEDGKTIAYIKKASEAHEPSLWYWIKFHSLGVKLHIRQFCIQINPFVKKPTHFITFSAISEGTRAEKELKKLGEKDAVLIPIPDEIDPRCGVVLAVHGEKKAREIYEKLKDMDIAVEAIYEKKGKEYERVYP
ncbi:sulfurtransferase TusA family protein [Aquifex aeolicus]|uniref:Putative sulfur carrier protein aq_1421 n=1 Tax=Aquifex aeolicus (strain VF5) TaxID=224324 RepID=Y1421_AQUAE|nr:sulfurtransferase TusA family protein [Aquifex aeolicus]O67415.1 RecName: Full=Putative sulfur carrier protein aq_1421 [Aquifex aeolicus VF5]AAC07381.1 hypothetical protein aq_1421 [Aquifex aeolicus VF5]